MNAKYLAEIHISVVFILFKNRTSSASFINAKKKKKGGGGGGQGQDKYKAHLRLKPTLNSGNSETFKGNNK